MGLKTKITIRCAACCLVMALVFHIQMRVSPSFRLNAEYVIQKIVSHFIQNFFVDLSGI